MSRLNIMATMPEPRDPEEDPHTFRLELLKPDLAGKCFPFIHNQKLSNELITKAGRLQSNQEIYATNASNRKELM